MKKYTRNQLLLKYNKLSATKQVPILWEALSYMQQYNGRSRMDCIAFAMGDSLGLEEIEENVFAKPLTNP